MELIEEIFTTMRMNKMRTFLTGFAITWGIFMLVVLLACGNGLRNGVSSNFSHANVNSVILYSGETSIPYNGMKRGRSIRFMPADIEFLRNNIPNSYDFTPIYTTWQGSVTDGDLQTNTTINGIEPVYSHLRKFTIEAGRFINELDLINRRKVMMIPKDLCEKYYSTAQEAVGKYLQFTDGTMCKIIGVYSMKARSWQPEIYIPLTTANILYNPSGEVGKITFGIDGITTKEDGERYTDQLRHLLAARFNFSPDDMNAVWINNNAQNYQQIQMVFTGISAFVWMIGIGTLIAGIVGVCNIMVVTVRERTREFGIRKAIGATPGSIIRMVVVEAVMITSMFGYIGMMLGIGLSEILCKIFPADAPAGNNMQSMFIEPSVDLPIIVSATLILVLAGITAGYIPARKAVRIKPIDAMAAK